MKPDDYIKRYEKRLQNIKQKLERRQKQTKTDYRRRLHGQRKYQNLLIGFNALNGRPIYLRPEQLNCHWQLLGGTQRGKSTLIEHIVRSLIEARRGLCLLDPHGDLYEAVLSYVTRKHLEDRVILIDPNQEDVAFGLNYLERGSHITKDIDAHVNMVMRAISKVFGGEDQETKPRLQRWERNATHALTEKGITLVELLDFLSLSKPELRRKIVEQLDDYYVKKEWDDFEAKRPQDQDLLIESVLNRANKFVGGQRMRRIVGQAASSIKWRDAMDEGKIILANLSAYRMSRENQKMLGVMIIDMIVEAAQSRVDIDIRKRKPFHLIIDEFDEFLCDDIAFIMRKLSKFKTYLLLAHQELQQLKQKSGEVYSSVMANTDVKIVFGTSREDAELMAKELFTGQIRGDKIKDVIEQTKFWPHESTRTVSTHGTSHLSGGGSAESSGTAGSKSTVTSTRFDPNTGLFFTDVLGLSEGSVETSGEQSNRATFDSWSDSETWSEAEVPFYEYEPFKEITSKAYFSTEELLEKFISWIMNQTPRHAQIKVSTKKTIPIVTPTVEPIRVSNELLKEFQKHVLALYARPVAEIDKQIEERRELLLGVSKEAALVEVISSKAKPVKRY